MRLAFCLFRYFPFSGLAKDMLHIADQAHRRDHQVHIYTADWQGDSSTHEVRIIPERGRSNHARAIGFYRALEPLLKSSRYDRVVGFNRIPGLDVYYAADTCFAARARYARHPLYRATPRYRAYAKLERAVFGPASRTHILALSGRAISEFQEFYGTQDSRFTLMPPNIQPFYRDLVADADLRQRVRCELRLPESGLMVLMVGSGFKTKGVDRAVRAMAALPEDVKHSVHLLIAGQGKAGHFIQLARHHGIRKQVRFLGGRTDVPDLLCAADLLLHPAYNENTGTVLLESMAAGLPVLTTDVCGYAHHVLAADAGRVLESPFEQDALDQQLHRMLCSDRTRWSRNGKRYMQQPLFYSMPDAAVDAIEREPGVMGGTRRKSEQFYYLSDTLNLPQRTVDEIMALPGEVFRRAPGRRTLRIGESGAAFFLKAHEGVGWREILKNLCYLRAPVLGADNEWHALHLLSRLGVKAPAPLGFGRYGRSPARRVSFILTDEISNAISLEQLAEREAGAIETGLKRKLILALAGIARTLHRNGINHRDFYLCHFLLKRDAAKPGGDTPVSSELYLIDLHRAQSRRRTPRRWIVKDLAGLYFSAMDVNLTRNDRLRFIRAYSGLPLRAALKTAPNWNRVQQRATVLYRSERAATV